MLLLKCAVCDSEKLTFIKEQEPSGLLSSLGINTSLSKIRLVGLFCFNSIKQVNTRYKINERVNTFSLAGDKSIPEMHLKQPEFTYSACGLFTKNKQRIQKFKETGDSPYIYKDELDKVCFQHDMANGDFKDLTRRTAYDKILHDKAFNIAKNSKYDGYQRGLALNDL